MNNKPVETITDEQGRQWILQKLHNQGLKYLFIDSYDYELMASEIPPSVSNFGRASVNPNAERQKKVLLEDFISFNGPYIDIGKELGIVDWSSVAVDTPVVVWDSLEGNWVYRHFAKYENGKVYTWSYGQTSWTSDKKDMACWINARLADVDKE